MKISVVTPVYNDPRIASCLQSVQQQRGEFKIEHIVVDSNSTDETVDILQEHDNEIDVLIREDDEGMYDAINKGIKQSTGDVIGILNADDRYQDDRVLQDIADTMSIPGQDACYGDLVYVDGHDEVVRYWKSGAFKPYKFYLGWMPPHPTFYVKSELYDELDGYDISFPISADYELLLRFLLLNDISVAYIDRVLVRMTLGGMSNSMGNMLQVIRDMYGAWSKHDQPGKFIAPFLHPVEKLPQFLRSPPEDIR